MSDSFEVICLEKICPFCILGAEGYRWVQFQELENMCEKHKQEMYESFFE